MTNLKFHVPGSAPRPDSGFLTVCYILQKACLTTAAYTRLNPSIIEGHKDVQPIADGREVSVPRLQHGSP